MDQTSGMGYMTWILHDDVSRYSISQKCYFIVYLFIVIILSTTFATKQFKARDFWEAQLSGDAPQRVVGSPKLRSFHPEVENDLQVPKMSIFNIVCLMEVWICTTMLEYVSTIVYIMDCDVQCLYLEFFRFGQIMYHEICFTVTNTCSVRKDARMVVPPFKFTYLTWCFCWWETHWVVDINRYCFCELPRFSGILCHWSSRYAKELEVNDDATWEDQNVEVGGFADPSQKTWHAKTTTRFHHQQLGFMGKYYR